MRKILYVLAAVLSVTACKTEKEITPPEISKASIAKHLETLSSDDFQGRMPCTDGETKTVEYITSVMKDIGIKPANNGSYLQNVPLVDISAEMSETMTIKSGSKSLTLNSGEDFVVHTERLTDAMSLDASELVFCGYGIISEKDNWNDYAGIDMKGKTAVVLVNDPGFGGEDSTFFKGNTMTIGGRWSTKYDYADRVGADGILIIHETASAGYPWFVVQSSWSGSQQGLAGIDRSEDCGVKGWITLDAAKSIFSESGQDLSAMIRSARKPGFKPVPLGATATVSLKSSYSTCDSKNIIGMVEGSKYPDEYVLYCAHWDHIGVGKVVEGDSIYNGALDNASGTATVLALAEMYAAMEPAPERSVVFLFVTAEEQGLLGSEYYSVNPVLPLNQTVANLNMDGVNPAGEMNDLTIVGMGHSEMDELAQVEAEKQGRYLLNEQEPEKGFFFRSDQFSFAKKGVPVIYAEGGYDHREKGKAYAKEFKETYTASRYHAPADEYDAATWNFDGMLQDGQLYFNLGLNLANSRKWPAWYPSSEFSRPKNFKD